MKMALNRELEKLNLKLEESQKKYLDGDYLTHPDLRLLPRLNHVVVAGKIFKVRNLQCGSISKRYMFLLRDFSFGNTLILNPFPMFLYFPPSIKFHHFSVTRPPKFWILMKHTNPDLVIVLAPLATPEILVTNLYENKAFE